MTRGGDIRIEDGRFYTVTQVCRWLLHAPQWFYRHRVQLERLGFPAPAPLLGHTRYRGSDLLDWDRRRVMAETLPPSGGEDGGKVIDLGQIARARSAALASRRKAS